MLVHRWSKHGNDLTKARCRHSCEARRFAVAVTWARLSIRAADSQVIGACSRQTASEDSVSRVRFEGPIPAVDESFQRNFRLRNKRIFSVTLAYCTFDAEVSALLYRRELRETCVVCGRRPISSALRSPVP